MLAMSSGAALGVWVLIIIAVGLIFYIWNMSEESKRTKEALGQSRSANQSLIREKQALEEAAEAAKMLREVKEEAEKRWHEDPEYRREIEEKTQRQVKEEEERLSHDPKFLRRLKEVEDVKIKVSYEDMVEDLQRRLDEGEEWE